MATLPTLTDGSLPNLYDCALNGVGFRVGWELVKNLAFRHDPYTETASDIIVEKSDTAVEELSENKVDKLYWESQRSWHHGAGQYRFDEPKTSSPYAFFSNQGVDTRYEGIAVLAADFKHVPDTSYDATGPTPYLVESGGFLFYPQAFLNNTPNYPAAKVTLNATDAGSFTVSTWTSGLTGGSTNMNVSQCACSDGANVYLGWTNATGPATLAYPFNSVLASGFAQINMGPASGTGAATYCSTPFGTGGNPPNTVAMAFVKQRLIAAGPLSTGDFRFRIFEVSPDPTPSTEIIVLPAGYQVPPNGITELAGFVLFLAVSSHNTLVYAWDGFTTPYVAAYLPEGDQGLCISTYLGVEAVIGGRRLKSNGGGTAGTGILFVGQATAAGQLVLQEVVEIGDGSIVVPLDAGNPTGATDSFDYAIFSLASKSSYTYFNWAQAPACGLYDHANQAYSRVTANVPIGNPVSNLAICQRRLAVLTSARGLSVENVSTLVASGQIVGSVMDWNIDKAKNILQAQFGTLPLPVGTSVTMDYSIDGGVTWTNVLTLNTTGATLAQTTSSVTNQFQLIEQQIQYRITMFSDTATHTLSPTLKKAGFGAWYGEKPQQDWTVAVSLNENQTMKNNAPFVFLGSTPQVVGPAPNLYDIILTYIRNLWSSQTVFAFQPPGYGDTHDDIFVCQCRGYTAYRWYESGVGFGGVCFVDIKEIP